jgi:murein L,D-transpeptidase YafK
VLEIFCDGALWDTAQVCTGKNPADKTREGDMATPEGKFYICYKNPRSRYTRFLGISYPNLEDARRGLRRGLITRGQFDRIRRAIEHRKCPPWKTALGGEVGLHGRTTHSGWTHGCITMDNAHILKLSRMLPLGTPVEIFH